MNVLFVCLGNICRSPMAEAVFNRMAADAGYAKTIKADSAGTGDWHLGELPHEGTRRLLEARGISCDGIRSRLITDEDFRSFDCIVCMDEQNLRDVRAMRGARTFRGELFTFMSLLPEKGMAGVPDPYYSGDFEEVYELVSEGCRRLLALAETAAAAGS